LGTPIDLAFRPYNSLALRCWLFDSGLLLRVMRVALNRRVTMQSSISWWN